MIEKSKKPKVEYLEGVEEGTYCNTAYINFTPYEFIFDFGTIIPGVPELGKEAKIRIHTRIRTSPQHAKAIYDLLKRKIEEYERKTNIRLETPKEEEKAPYG